VSTREPKGKEKHDLSVTALYTSQVWVWGGFDCAPLFATKEAKAVFSWTNGALMIAKLFMWRLKSLKHSLLHRHAMIDWLLSRSGSSQVLELAAGLSRRGAAFSASPGVAYVEVDLPHVVKKKRELLERTPEGKAVVSRQNLRLVPGDVTELDLAALVEPGRRFVIAEGLLMYLKPDEQRALWGRIAALMAGVGGTFVFDLVPWVEQPKPGLFGRALEWVMKRFTGGKAFERDLRTRADICADLQAVGFTSVKCHEPGDVAQKWGLPSPTVSTQQLVFEAEVATEPA